MLLQLVLFAASAAAVEFAGVFHESASAEDKLRILHTFPGAVVHTTGFSFEASGDTAASFLESHGTHLANFGVSQTFTAQTSGCSRSTHGAGLQGSHWGLDLVDGFADGAFTPPVCSNGTVHLFVLDTGVAQPDGQFPQGYGAGACFGSDCSNGWIDDEGHGTFCASIAAGNKAGVYPGATVHPVKVLDRSGSGTTSSVTQGISWVINKGLAPAVISMSLGGPYDPMVNSAVNRAAAAGITVVVAAGNENVDACTQSPASAPGAITVGAMDATRRRASFSNWGTCVTLYAPGTDIVGSWISHDYALASGTSMATPFVAGAVAWLLAMDPLMTPMAVSRLLVATGKMLNMTAMIEGGHEPSTSSAWWPPATSSRKSSSLNVTNIVLISVIPGTALIGGLAVLLHCMRKHKHGGRREQRGLRARLLKNDEPL